MRTSPRRPFHRDGSRSIMVRLRVVGIEVVLAVEDQRGAIFSEQRGRSADCVLDRALIRGPGSNWPGWTLLPYYSLGVLLESWDRDRSIPFIEFEASVDPVSPRGDDRSQLGSTSATRHTVTGWLGHIGAQAAIIGQHEKEPDPQWHLLKPA